MRRVLSVALAVAVAAGAALAAGAGGSKPKRRKAKPAMSAEQQKKKLERSIKGWTGQVSRYKKEQARIQKDLGAIVDAGIKKELEETSKTLGTVIAGLESAIGAAEQGDAKEAARISRDISKAHRALGMELLLVPLKTNIDKYTQLAQKSAGNADVAAACHKVVEASKKQIELRREMTDLYKQISANKSEIQKAQRAARPKPKRKPRVKKPRPNKGGGRKGKRVKKAKKGGEAIE